MPYLTDEEIASLGLAYAGRNLKISSLCVINNPETTYIDDFSRLDDFSIISGKVKIGKYVHIAVMNNLAGGNYGIEIGSAVGIAYGCHIFSQTDDYSGKAFVSPLFSEKLTAVSGGTVVIQDFSTIGTGSIIFPKVNMAEGTAVGAMSLVNRSTMPWGIYIGNPAKRVKERSMDYKKLFNLEFFDS